jgi:SAM-dependent methyltransferase
VETQASLAGAGIAVDQAGGWADAVRRASHKLSADGVFNQHPRGLHLDMTLRQHFWRRWRQVRRRLQGIPEAGAIDFGQLRRPEPFGRQFGADRGQPLDRYYIEAFLAEQQNDLRGQILEVGDDTYTRRFGGGRVTGSDILHVSSGNKKATIVADLSNAPQIPDATFDALIVTQTLHLIYDAPAAVRTMHRILRPGGVLLLTVPGITQIPNGTLWAHSWFWSFTTLSVTRMLTEAFGSGHVSVRHYGNVLSAASMLYGLAAEDLTTDELDNTDEDFPVIIGARAHRPAK